MKIKNTFLEKQWTNIRDQISKLGQVPVAQKILFYKVFIRPLLIFNWIKGCANDLKAIEMETLKQIFGDERQTEVYRQYSDIDVSGYLKLQESRWSPWKPLSKNFLKSMLHATKHSCDPCPYFVRALTLPKARPTLRRRRARIQRRRTPQFSSLYSPVSEETLDSQSFVDTLFDTTLNSDRNLRLSPVSEIGTVKEMRPRRSLRLANKNSRRH